MSGSKKQRLDNSIVARGLAPTLDRARSLVMAGRVVVDGRMIDKPGIPVAHNAAIRIKEQPSAYVSRGGDKLAGPLDRFSISVAGRTVIDVGASTGGFTDCLLTRGSSRVYAVDVGYGQLAWKLRQDARVVPFDRRHITALSAEELNPLPSLAVIDLSFISLQSVLSHVCGLLTSEAEIIALVKPQFEAAKGSVEPGGLVTDEHEHQRVMNRIVEECLRLSLFVAGIMESPLQGRKGNREFFIYMGKGTAAGLPK